MTPFPGVPICRRIQISQLHGIAIVIFGCLCEAWTPQNGFPSGFPFGFTADVQKTLVGSKVDPIKRVFFRAMYSPGSVKKIKKKQKHQTTESPPQKKGPLLPSEPSVRCLRRQRQAPQLGSAEALGRRSGGPAERRRAVALDTSAPRIWPRQTPNRSAPSEHLIQSNHQNRKPKMGGEFTYPKMVLLVLTHRLLVVPFASPQRGAEVFCNQSPKSVEQFGHIVMLQVPGEVGGKAGRPANLFST